MKIEYESNCSALRPWTCAAVRRFLTAWLTAAGIESIIAPGPLAELSTIAALSPLRLALVAAIIFAVLHFIPQKFQRWALPAGRLLLGHRLYTVSPAGLTLEPMGFCAVEE